jgi:endonuclease/exonuclease/phosphatase family metal-dependent hydrolase
MQKIGAMRIRELPTHAEHSGHTRGVRLTTWNLKDCPTPQGARGQRIEDVMAQFKADITLLTEVHADWAIAGQAMAMSPQRRGYDRQNRHAGVHSTLPMERLEIRDEHPAEEESLCLVRVKTADSGISSVLVACSVMPWRGASRWWSGLREVSNGEGLAPQFTAVLQHHVRSIVAARLPKEPVIWGGDFNQELNGPIAAGSVEGRAELLKAFERLNLKPLTMKSRHLMSKLGSIDHLAVSSGWMTWGEPVVRGEAGAHFPSDHALYEVEGT